jgi:hypothetical protein
MKARHIRPTRVSGLPFLLVMAQLCLAFSLRAQDAPPTGAEPSNTPPPAASAVSPPASDASPSTPDASLATPESSPGSPLYFNQNTQPLTYGEPGFGIVRRVPASEFDAPEYGVPYSSVLYNNPADPFSTHSFGLNTEEYPKFGEAYGSVSFGYAGLGLSSIPFIHHAFAPLDADLKAGPLYLYFDSLEAALLYTDNYKLSDTNRQSELLAIISLNMTLVAQLTEDLQFSITGSVIYLPIQNIVGFESSTLEGSLGFLLGALPALTSNVVYDTLVAGWPVEFKDVFQTSTGHYSDSTVDNFSLFQGGVLDRQQNGQYTFRSGHADLRFNSGNNNNDTQNNYFNFFSNTISATTYGDLPSDVQLTARAARSDLWYNQGNRGLPSSRDDFYILAQSVRPTMRFKPFASYEVTHSSDVPGVYQIFTAGFSGPITDQLFLYADAGYFISNTGNEGSLWTLELQHTAGENTTEDLEIRRGLNDFDDEVITTEYYRINQILGPTLNAVGFADHSSFQELADDQVSNRDQEDFGVGLNWILGPLTTLELRGIYTHQNFDDGFKTDTWTGRVDLSRTITNTLFLRAFYQYQNYDAHVANRQYYENLIFVSLTKYFH